MFKILVNTKHRSDHSHDATSVDNNHHDDNNSNYIKQEDPEEMKIALQSSSSSDALNEQYHEMVELFELHNWHANDDYINHDDHSSCKKRSNCNEDLISETSSHNHRNKRRKLNSRKLHLVIEQINHFMIDNDDGYYISKLCKQLEEMTKRLHLVVIFDHQLTYEKSEDSNPLRNANLMKALAQVHHDELVKLSDDSNGVPIMLPSKSQLILCGDYEQNEYDLFSNNSGSEKLMAHDLFLLGNVCLLLVSYSKLGSQQCIPLLISNLVRYIYNRSQNPLHKTIRYNKETFVEKIWINATLSDYVRSIINCMEKAYPIKIDVTKRLCLSNSFLEITFRCENNQNKLVEVLDKFSTFLSNDPNLSLSGFPPSDKQLQPLSFLGNFLSSPISLTNEENRPANAKFSDLNECIYRACKVIEESFQNYGGPENIALSFNGGKDCTVLLQLVHSVLKKRGENDFKIKTLYVIPNDPFIEVEEFVEDCVKKYNLDITRYTGGMKLALQEFLDKNPSIKGILIGTRRTDPFADKLNDFDPTDNGWPKVIRVHPILDWNYVYIWQFLRSACIPYCSLYDQGYTSIGGKGNTLPNEHLKDDRYSCGYLPAYKLIEDALERDGRMKKK